MATREENLLIIATYTELDHRRDEQVQAVVYETLGVNALSDEAVELMAQTYLRLAETPPTTGVMQ